jgi:hypothetical protein
MWLGQRQGATSKAIEKTSGILIVTDYRPECLKFVQRAS